MKGTKVEIWERHRKAKMIKKEENKENNLEKETIEKYRKKRTKKQEQK